MYTDGVKNYKIEVKLIYIVITLENIVSVAAMISGVTITFLKPADSEQLTSLVIEGKRMCKHS